MNIGLFVERSIRAMLWLFKTTTDAQNGTLPLPTYLLIDSYYRLDAVYIWCHKSCMGFGQGWIKDFTAVDQLTPSGKQQILMVI